MNRRSTKSARAAGTFGETWIDGSFPGGDIAFSIKFWNEEKPETEGEGKTG